MTSEPSDEDDHRRGTAETSIWAAAREEQRIEHEVLRRVRRHRHGKTTMVIAEELRREFAAARMPWPPERVQNCAQAMAQHRWPATYFLGQLVDMAVHRRIPPGLQPEQQWLPGRQWVPVQLADTPMARFALRNFRWLQGLAQQVNPSAPLSARLIGMPGLDGREEVAALFGSTFVGALAPEHAATLISVIEEADVANRKLTVGARIDEADTLFVSIPG